MSESLVSIIILSYKNLEYIKETIQSILMQSYSEIEIIISDDGTEGFDSNFFEKMINENNLGNIKNTVVYTNEKNLGIVKNVNKAISLCSGQYIKTIAADDVFYANNVIQTMVSSMKEKNCLLLTTNILWCDELLEELPIAKYMLNKYRNELPVGVSPELFLKKLGKECIIPAPGTMYHKKLFTEYQFIFNEDYILLDDWPMWLKLVRQGIVIEYLDIVSVKYRHNIGVSSNKNPNLIYQNDWSKFVETEIISKRDDFDNWTVRNILYSYLKNREESQYSFYQKFVFYLKNIDILTVNQMKKIHRHFFQLYMKI